MDGLIDLRLCDARDGLTSLANDSIDMVFTDPPYRTISGGDTESSGASQSVYGRPSGILAKNDGKVFRHNDIHISEWAPELYRVLKSPGHCYVMCNMLNLWHFHHHLTEVGFKVHNLLVWKKNNVVVNRWGGKNGEYCFFLRKGPARALYENFPTVLEVDNVKRSEKTHPTEKPTDLVERYIRGSSRRGFYVLDPFAGTGSTAVAAKNNDRRFVGFEIDPEYYAIACRRLGTLPRV